MNQVYSTHIDEKRCIVGVWLVDEVRKAIEMGYGLLTVFEFWEIEITYFDRGTKSADRFAEFVQMFLKFKNGIRSAPLLGSE
jgi:hypothetical protein